MAETLLRKDYERIFREFNQVMESILSADRQTYDSKVKECVTLIEDSQILKNFMQHYLDNSITVNEVMRGWNEFIFPGKSDEQIAFLLKLFYEVYNGTCNLSVKLYEAFGNKTLNDNYYAFNKNVVRSCYDKLKQKFNDYIEDKFINIQAMDIIGDTHMDKTKVFIVHGHDNEAKEKTARFIEKLSLTPIILHEQASSGNTIIEKIEQYSNVGYGIVLYTPCDMGKAKDENDYQNRARQNVIFEHGFLIGKLGRRNVCELVKGDIEKPNDISGVVYIPMDDADSWKMSIFKELKAIGYEIDANKIVG